MSNGQERRHRYAWTKEEDQFLRNNNSLSIKELAAATDRTIYAVAQRRMRLGLGRRTWKVQTCKICGKPRYEESTHALCEDHYLEYYRIASEKQRRKQGAT